GQYVLTSQVGQGFALKGRGAFRRNQGGVLQRQLQHELRFLGIVLEVTLFTADLDLVQRRLRNVDVAALDQLRHLTIEQRQQQRADVRTVHVRVSHDDDAVIAQLVDIEVG